jgi:hypothetical protein
MIKHFIINGMKEPNRVGFKVTVLCVLSWMTLQMSAGVFAADFYGPRPMNVILESPFEAEWTPQAVAEIRNREHVVLLDAATKSKVIALTDVAAPGLTVVDLNALDDEDITYGDVLSAMFQLQDANIESLSTQSLTSTYMLRPELLSYYAVDADAEDGAAAASELAVRDVKSTFFTNQSTIGYLALTFTSSAASTKIKAGHRYAYDTASGTFSLDNSWSQAQWLVIQGDVLGLTTNEAQATEFFVADARDLIDVVIDPGSDLNPASIDWQTNSFASWPTNPSNGELETDSMLDSLLFDQACKEIDTAYLPQMDISNCAPVPVSDASRAAAEDMLNQIEAVLSANGESLRYDKALYLAARDNMLSHTVSAIDEVNAVLGERLIAYIYFTMAKDSSGVYHPFMVVGAHNGSGGPNFLVDVARPPGDGLSNSYETMGVTRTAVLAPTLFRIPLKDYGVVADFTDNDLSSTNSLNPGLRTLAGDANLAVENYTVYNYASNSVNGLAVDGVKIYPAMNNTLVFGQINAEVTSTGIHVGRGMGLHYHADGHSFNGNGINLYNADDYPGHSHPPLIGFGLDGLALYGKYDESYPDMAGYAEPLDELGTHSHEGYGVHYHAFTASVSDRWGRDQYNFTQHFLLVGAYKGDISKIPGLQNGGTNQLKDAELAKYVGASGTYTALQVTQYSVTTASSSGGVMNGTGTYYAGESVTFTAVPDSGYVFSGWSGDITGNVNPLTVVISQNMAVQANFEVNPANTTRYTVTTSSSDGGTLNGAGTYDAGESLTLTAVPDSGYVFSGWSGDITSDDNPLTLLISKNLSVQANFKLSSSNNPDADGDGIIDDWERLYGLDPTNVRDAYFDLDQDGYLNWEEFYADTDPTIASGPAQVLYTDRAATLIPGSSARLSVRYTTTDTDPNLSGMGVRVHYNSKYLTAISLENIFETSLLSVGEPVEDSFDLDGDAETDSYILVAWVSFSGPTWPGELGQVLFDVVLSTTSEIAELEEYPIRFSVSDTPIGYNLSAPSIYNPVVLASLDIDGDGEAKALTDGLMIIRRLFGFSGNSLSAGAVAASATYTTSAELAARIDAFATGLDIDGDGETKALTDGLMIIRRLFGFSGTSLIAGAVSATATRTQSVEIAAYIDSLMP